MTKIITDKQIQSVISWSDAIECVENTWKWYGEGKVIMPTKVTTDMTSMNVPGWFNSMPSYIGPMDAAGLKIVGGYYDNPKNGLPYIRANVVILNPRSGDLKAVIGGDWISLARTGSQPAIACKYLSSKTDVVCIIGSGLQARASLKCMAARLDIKEVRVCDLRPEARRDFIRDFEGCPFRMIDCETNQEGCTDADVIITLTTANAHLVENEWVKKGALVLTMGSYTEIADELSLGVDKRFTDHMGQCLHRGNFKELVDAGKIGEKDFAGIISDVMTGRIPGRENPDERIIMAIIGMGAPDLTIGALALQRIEEQGIEVAEIDIMG